MSYEQWKPVRERARKEIPEEVLKRLQEQEPKMKWTSSTTRRFNRDCCWDCAAPGEVTVYGSLEFSRSTGVIRYIRGVYLRIDSGSPLKGRARVFRARKDGSWDYEKIANEVIRRARAEIDEKERRASHQRDEAETKKLIEEVVKRTGIGDSGVSASPHGRSPKEIAVHLRLSREQFEEFAALNADFLQKTRKAE